ncbi:MAG: class I SAM-dependent methyltransferase [Bacteroidota bacterium]|nr:class I SAM-dependent methyltransferase [Bacteroidota bacterium]
MPKNYISIIEGLGSLGAFQFASYISGSQYIKAYDLVNKYVPNPSSALDWGTGSGHFSYFLLNSGHNVTGFSVEDECQFSGYLKDNFHNVYNLIVTHDSTLLPFESNTFDLVVSIGVLEHVKETGGNELGSLEEIKRVLKPNGKFICYHFPNKFSWIESITQHLKNKHHHNYKYTKADIKHFLKETDLRLLEYGRYGFLPRLSFRFVPNNILSTKIFNIVDNLLSLIFNPFCQNNYFVAEKK